MVRGVSVVSGYEFKFKIPLNKDIDTTYGVSEGCELERIDFYPKSSGEQIRAHYLVNNLPEEKQSDSFAADDGAKNSIEIIYEAKTNSIKNVCLKHDKFGHTDESSPRMIPIFIQE